MARKAVGSAVSLAIAVVIVIALASWRPPADATVQLASISSAVVSGQVTFKFSVYATGVRLDSPTGQADVVLPVPQSQCAAIAAEVAGTCDTGGVTTAQSVDVSWASPAEVRLLSHQGGTTTLTGPPTTSAGRLDVEVSGGQAPRLCLAATPVALSVGSLGNPVDVAPAGGQLPPLCSGLVLRQHATYPGDSTFSIDHIVSASATLTGQAMQARAANSKITVDAADIHDATVDDAIDVESRTPFTLTADGWPLDADVRVTGATRLMTGPDERRPTVWTRVGKLVDAALSIGAVLAVVAPFVPWLYQRVRPRTHRAAGGTRR